MRKKTSDNENMEHFGRTVEREREREREKEKEKERERKREREKERKREREREREREGEIEIESEREREEEGRWKGGSKMAEIKLSRSRQSKKGNSCHAKRKNHTED